MDYSPSANQASFCTQQILLVLGLKYISVRFCMAKMQKYLLIGYVCMLLSLLCGLVLLNPVKTGSLTQQGTVQSKQKGDSQSTRTSKVQSAGK